MKTLVLVYQAGLANIFEVDAHGRKRIFQGAFKQAEWFMRGAQHAGASVDVLGCNMAGDIAERSWTRNLEILPFHDDFGCAWMQQKDSAELYESV